MLGVVIDDVLVDLVRDRQRVPFDAEVADRLELGAREDVAAGVVRRVDVQRSGVGRDRRFDGRSELRGLRERGRVDRHRRGPEAAHDAGDERPIRREHHDLLARCDEPADDRPDPPGRTGRDEHVRPLDREPAARPGPLDDGVEHRARAEEEARRIVENGEKQLQAPREQVVAELRGEMGQNSINLAERLLGTELSDSTRRSNTIDEFLSELDNVSTRK